MSSSSSNDDVLSQWSSDPQCAFILGVELAFERWATLHLATENDDQIDEFIDYTIDIFLKDHSTGAAPEPFYWDEICDYLYDALLENFNVDAQDGSCEQTAKLLCQLYSDCFLNKNFNGLLKMSKESKRVQSEIQNVKSQTQIQQSSDEELASDSKDMSDEEEMPQLVASTPSDATTNALRNQRPESGIDDEGFKTVTRKGRRR